MASHEKKIRPSAGSSGHRFGILARLGFVALVAAALAGPGCASTGSFHGIARAGAGGAPQSYSDTLSLAATGTTTARYTGNASTLGYYCTTTGTPTGTWGLQYSADGTNWDTYTLSTTPPAAAGSPQVFGLTLQFYEYPWARLSYTRSSGTGSLTCSLFLK